MVSDQHALLIAKALNAIAEQNNRHLKVLIINQVLIMALIAFVAVLA